MANTNSYSENMARLTQAANDILEVANAVNETISGNDAEVVVKEDVTFPSYQNVINRVDRAERTIARFTEGKGVVETDDGTYRKIRVETISRPANDVGFLDKVENFDIDPNWFFESLQYPRCVVKIDLAGKIEDDSDRVFVSRLIIDQDQARLTQEIKDEILNTTLSYGEFVEYLENNFIEYKEDKDEVPLPLTYERYNGSFQVNGINLEKDKQSGLNYTWYYLSGISYSTVNDNGDEEDNGNILQVDDYLRFNNTLFKIKEINQTDMKVRLEYNVGYDTVGLYDTLEFYNDPFKEKIISVGICVNEIDVVYIKGVNEKFNVLSREWSLPLAFDTNILKFSKDNTQTFESYYAREVADFGRMWIAQIKEGRLPAYGGKTPNAPTLNKDDLKVVQINTQLNATLDSERYNSITSEIASVKSNITATRNTIAANKNKLITEYDTYRRDVIKNSINTDTEKLNNFTTQFSSLVDELNTLLTDAGAINYTSKYHIRGFFAIPEPQYTVDDGETREGKQEIIAFEIMYRYLHTDETGTRLNTFTYNDSSIKENGVFSDWSIMTSPTLEKQYNSETDTFEWKAETLDGTHVTINQVDIPIRSGEKVEIKARSISESGYPYSPLKSDWSNSVIITFPDNLMTDDSVTTILKSVKDDMTSVVLQETLSAAGIYTHISDSNSQYKHNAENIEYTETVIDPDTGESKIVTMSVADKLRALAKTNTTEEETPGIEFAVTNKDGSTYGGKIKISTPNLSSNARADLEEELAGLATDAIDYIRTELDASSEGELWEPKVTAKIINSTGDTLIITKQVRLHNAESGDNYAGFNIYEGEDSTQYTLESGSSYTLDNIVVTLNSSSKKLTTKYKDNLLDTSTNAAYVFLSSDGGHEKAHEYNSEYKEVFTSGSETTLRDGGYYEIEVIKGESPEPPGPEPPGPEPPGPEPPGPEPPGPSGDVTGTITINNNYGSDLDIANVYAVVSPGTTDYVIMGILNNRDYVHVENGTSVTIQNVQFVSASSKLNRSFAEPSEYSTTYNSNCGITCSKSAYTLSVNDISGDFVTNGSYTVTITDLSKNWYK